MDDESRTRDNWMALAACILTKKTPDKCIKAMGIEMEYSEYGHEWDEKTINEAVKLRNSGLSWKKTFEKLGVEDYHDSLKQFCYQHEDYRATAHGRIDFTDEELEKISEMREQGLSWSTIGKELGHGAPTVAKAYKIKTGELKPSSALKWNREFFDEVTALRAEGYTFTEIGRMYGRSKSAMSSGYARVKRIYENEKLQNK